MAAAPTTLLVLGGPSFALDATVSGHGGPVNVASRRGHATMGTLLDACLSAAGGADASFTWVPADVVTGAGAASGGAVQWHRPSTRGGTLLQWVAIRRPPSGRWWRARSRRR